ncbi:MAG: hypothetical protein AB1916_08390 [Thermodesulfobacteriota bacterium]
MRRLAPILALAASLVLAAAPAAAQGGQATCADTYKIYQTCYDGGKGMDLEGCSYVVQALGPRLMGEEGVSGLSSALSVAMCKQGCEDGARKKPPMSMSAFSASFCRGLK